MAESNFTVYLEHLIPRARIERAEFLNERAATPVWGGRKWPKHLTLRDLHGDDPVSRRLKKLDTQRVTDTWTPDECVGLLEAVLKERYVPEVILWCGPDGRVYLVDGGHRISTLIAWLADDWGDCLEPAAYRDEARRVASETAAQSVRALLKERGVGFFDDHQSALASADVGLQILWLRGNYAQAEASLLGYMKGLSELCALHNNRFDTPESQAAHERLLEKLRAEPEPRAPGTDE